MQTTRRSDGTTISSGPQNNWDHETHEEFFRYYEKESVTAKTVHRFQTIRDTVIRLNPGLMHRRPCRVADIGCGAGTQSLLWAELGYEVNGLDVNRPLLDVARRRAAEAGYTIEFSVGSAVSLPWPDGYIDVCLAVELLEHVADWRSCLEEFTRVLRPGGVLFLSTTNVLCPIQQEFNLPLYSWYPGTVKRYCEKLAKTTRPRLANYAKYPAENWFTFYRLRSFLNERAFDSLDRFDLIDVSRKGTFARAILGAIRSVPALRWVAHVATQGTSLIAIKRQ
jgi:2-polyprenyl-3-methyl-5-hydroxy-6-metoxy-1,4-benzoquinol methylase